MKSFLLVLVAATAVASLSSCASHSGGWDPDSAQYAAYATQIPLYPGTKITDAMGSEGWGDEPDSYAYSQVWWCETKATREKVLAFYESKLPNATRSTPYQDGSIELKVIPTGAQPKEYMGVLIGEDGKYRVFESRKSKQIHRS